MDYLKINKETWDKRAKVHLTSEFYDVDGFLAGKTSLKEIELAEMGDVNGKHLLHLQCHFGLDTLSWARQGAIVTGVDLSPAAIAQAEQIKKKAGLKANFICTDVYEYGKNVKPEYDIVFTSYGVLVWLPDIKKWAQTVANSLKSGGKFYMVEFHPLYDILTGYPYFYHAEAEVYKENTYTENATDEMWEIATWAHPLSDVINALIQVGIQIDHLNEFPFSPYDCFEGLEEKKPGQFYLEKSSQEPPLVYSISGTKR